MDQPSPIQASAPAPAPAPAGKGPSWARAVSGAIVMVATFVVVMVVVNSAASALGGPVAALLLGPALGMLVLGLYFLAVRFIERRPVTELARPGAARRVLSGLLGGVAVAATTVGIIAALGGYQITGWGTISGGLTVVGMMCAVAVSEEVLFRGVIFGLIQGRWGSWIALIASGLMFGLVHLVNPGATLWGAFAVAIEAGLMLGAAYIVSGSLWLPIGLHLGWNISTVAIFGTIGSGGDARAALVEAVTHGPTWLTGGDFGPEGSLVAVAVCSLATVFLLASARRPGRIVGRRRYG